MYLGVLIESKFLHRQAAEIGLYKTGKNWQLKLEIKTMHAPHQSTFMSVVLILPFIGNLYKKYTSACAKQSELYFTVERCLACTSALICT